MNLSSFFRNAGAEPTKPVMVIPKLAEMRQTAYRADLQAKIEAQLDTAARQLASHNFWHWDRCMLNPALGRWDETQLCFVGMDLSEFCAAVEREFDCQTDDGRSWRLDRCVGARLWEHAVKPGVLPIASFDVQLERRKERTCAA
jgi:hypothetical protein